MSPLVLIVLRLATLTEPAQSHGVWFSDNDSARPRQFYARPAGDSEYRLVRRIELDQGGRPGSRTVLMWEEE